MSSPAAKTRLLDAALKVIRSKGYSATTVDDLCAAAGVTKGAFFHHFKSKEDMAVAAAGHFSQMADGLFVMLPPRAGNDPLLRLFDYIDLRIAIIQGALPQFTCLLGTMVQEAFETHPAIRQACDLHIRHHADKVAAMIREAREHYCPTAPWTAESLAQFTQAAIQGGFILAKAQNGPEAAIDSLRHLRRYVEMLFEVPPTEEERTMTKPAPFIWHDLMTTDVKAAEKFYAAVVGWNINDGGMPEMNYRVLNAGDAGVGGIMGTMPGGPPPMWTGYVYSSDVDADAAHAAKLGGSVCKAPEDIPGVGRFAVIADPGGAMLNIFKPNSAESPTPVPRTTPGHIAWHDLRAGNLDIAWAFYQEMFGWTVAQDLSMGPMGTYRIFATGKDPVGGMMTKPPQVPMAHWQLYFAIADGIEAGASRITANGGKIINGPMEVPGGEWIVEAMDPQGAMFGLAAQRK